MNATGTSATGSLTDRGKSLGRLPASVDLTPAAIERFATLLHIVFAHKFNPHALEVTAKEANDTAVKRHHREAMAYLQAMLVKNDRVMVIQDIDGVLARYTIQAKGDSTPLVVCVNPTQPYTRCLSVQTPSGVFAEIDLDTVKIKMPRLHRDEIPLQ